MKKEKLAIVAGNSPEKLKKKLRKFEFEVLETIQCKETYDSISYHPDISMHKVNGEKLILAPNQYDYYSRIFSSYNIKLIRGQTRIEESYPYNIGYNVGRIGAYAFHNLKYTDPILLKELEKEGVEFINVRQGYSKCSMAIVDDNSFITSDKGIYRKAKELGLNVLLIDHGHIELAGQEYGFIGGASGSFGNKFFLAGSLNNHPNRYEIIKFIKSRDKEPIYLMEENLLDIGSIIII